MPPRQKKKKQVEKNAKTVKKSLEMGIADGDMQPYQLAEGAQPPRHAPHNQSGPKIISKRAVDKQLIEKIFNVQSTSGLTQNSNTSGTSAKKKKKALPVTCEQLIKDNEEHLAEWVRSNTCMWKRGDASWFNAELKHALCNAEAARISEANPEKPAITGVMIKKWLDMMRDRYAKITKLKKSGSGRKELTDREIFIKRVFSFLEHHISRRVGIVVDLAPSDEEATQSLDKDSESGGVIESGPSSPESTPQKHSCGASASIKRKLSHCKASESSKTQKRQREAEDKIDVQARLVDLLAQVITPPSNRPENAYGHYLETVAASMHPDLQVEFHSKVSPIAAEYHARSLKMYAADEAAAKL